MQSHVARALSSYQLETDTADVGGVIPYQHGQNRQQRSFVQ